MRAAEPPRARYGQVWTVGYATRPDDPPPVPYLVVSGDLYNESGLGVIGVEVLPGTGNRELAEPIPGLGMAQFDMLCWYPPAWLVEHVADLPEQRHADVARLVRNLIGNA